MLEAESSRIVAAAEKHVKKQAEQHRVTEFIGVMGFFQRNMTEQMKQQVGAKNIVAANDVQIRMEMINRCQGVQLPLSDEDCRLYFRSSGELFAYNIPPGMEQAIGFTAACCNLRSATTCMLIQNHTGSIETMSTTCSPCEGGKCSGSHKGNAALCHGMRSPLSDNDCQLDSSRQLFAFAIYEAALGFTAACCNVKSATRCQVILNNTYWIDTKFTSCAPCKDGNCNELDLHLESTAQCTSYPNANSFLLHEECYSLHRSAGEIYAFSLPDLPGIGPSFACCNLRSATKCEVIVPPIVTTPMTFGCSLCEDEGCSHAAAFPLFVVMALMSFTI